jgi:putative restriction endonuclease
MCKIHHAAYDSDILGIRPDRVIRLRSDVLMEQDGPTLRYSLQGLHGEQMQVPRRRAAHPSVDLLEERWDRFKQSA